MEPTGEAYVASRSWNRLEDTLGAPRARSAPYRLTCRKSLCRSRVCLDERRNEQRKLLELYVVFVGRAGAFHAFVNGVYPVRNVFAAALSFPTQALKRKIGKRVQRTQHTWESRSALIHFRGVKCLANSGRNSVQFCPIFLLGLDKCSGIPARNFDSYFARN